MTLEEEILVRIEAAKALNKDAKLSDFQFKATNQNSFLINLKTGAAELLCDKHCEDDFEQFLRLTISRHKGRG